MSSGLYSTDKKAYDKTLDLSKIKPYGDTLNDGKVQVSFTLPLPDNAKSSEAARLLGEKMGLMEAHVAFSKPLDEGFTFYVVYGSLIHFVDYHGIQINAAEEEILDMQQTDEFIKEYIGRKIVILGASTGTDAHTVGIDAIMNMKGYAGHYGLERYEMIEAMNMGSQVDNEDFLRKAIEIKADVLLVSQTVTQKNVHVQNLTDLVELLEASGMRDRLIIICGGPRITHELAKELGYDAGFGTGKYADNVATFVAKEMKRRGNL